MEFLFLLLSFQVVFSRFYLQATSRPVTGTMCHLLVITGILLLGPSMVLPDLIHQSTVSANASNTDSSLQPKTATNSSVSIQFSTPKKSLTVKVCAIVAAFWLFDYALSIVLLEFSNRAVSLRLSVVSAITLFGGASSIVVVLALHLSDKTVIMVVIAVTVIPIILALLVGIYLLIAGFLFKYEKPEKPKKQIVAQLKMGFLKMENRESTGFKATKGIIACAGGSKYKFSPWVKNSSFPKFAGIPFSKQSSKAKISL